MPTLPWPVNSGVAETIFAFIQTGPVAIRPLASASPEVPVLQQVDGFGGCAFQFCHDQKPAIARPIVGLSVENRCCRLRLTSASGVPGARNAPCTVTAARLPPMPCTVLLPGEATRPQNRPVLWLRHSPILRNSTCVQPSGAKTGGSKSDPFSAFPGAGAIRFAPLPTSTACQLSATA